MNRIKMLRLFKAVCFMLVLAIALVGSSYILAPKDNTKSCGITNPNANGFYSEKKNSIDIFVIGNSDAYSGFSPMELWKHNGYTSYVSAEGLQAVSQSYNTLKKVLTCQSPKIVMLETDGVFTKENFTQSIINIFNASMGTSFSVFQYHNMWKHITPRDMLRKPKYTAHCATKGQKLSNNVKGYFGKEYMIKTDELQKIPLSSEKSLDVFSKLCKDNDITLVLITLPSQNSWNYKKHNAMQKYADENKLNYIDLNIDREKFDFNWKTDTRDKGNHLNNRGARKATRYIGDFLKDNFKIVDHRQDNAYKIWDRDYRDYEKNVKI